MLKGENRSFAIVKSFDQLSVKNIFVEKWFNYRQPVIFCWQFISKVAHWKFIEGYVWEKSTLAMIVWFSIPILVNFETFELSWSLITYYFYLSLVIAIRERLYDSWKFQNLGGFVCLCLRTEFLWPIYLATTQDFMDQCKLEDNFYFVHL